MRPVGAVDEMDEAGRNATLEAFVEVLQSRMGRLIAAQERVIWECEGYLGLLADLLGQAETLGVDRTLALARELIDDALVHVWSHTRQGSAGVADAAVTSAPHLFLDFVGS